MDQRPTKSWLKRFLGFVVDPNQVNVALTRAQEGLCLVGEGCWGRAAGRGCSRAGCPLHAGPPDRPSCRRPPPAAMLPPVAPPPGLLRGPAELGACGAGAGAEEAGRGSLKRPLSHALPSGCVRPGGPAQRVPMCLQQPLPAPMPTAWVSKAGCGHARSPPPGVLVCPRWGAWTWEEGGSMPVLLVDLFCCPWRQAASQGWAGPPDRQDTLRVPGKVWGREGNPALWPVDGMPTALGAGREAQLIFNF